MSEPPAGGSAMGVTMPGGWPVDRDRIGEGYKKAIVSKTTTI